MAQTGHSFLNSSVSILEASKIEAVYNGNVLQRHIDEPQTNQLWAWGKKSEAWKAKSIGKLFYTMLQLTVYMVENKSNILYH